jgi:CheY-like chemotaxis protein
MSGTEAKPYTILIVDDDPDYLYQQELQLKNAGYTVLTADGQATAREILASTKPDLAIFDLMMDNPDGGFVLAYELKQKDPTVPIILVSAVVGRTGLDFDTASDEERAWVKADVILSKPVRMEQLQREITRLLGEQTPSH